MLTLSIFALIFAAIPAALFCANLRAYAPPPRLQHRGAEESAELPSISVLIPARNEEFSIEAAVRSVLASTCARFEVVVMDDASTDRTSEIVRALSVEHPEVRLEHAPPLPPGWNGKQHACWQLAQHARHDLLCFIDADVRLVPEALARMSAFLDTSRSALVSGFPLQQTRTTLEWLLLPLIHFVLLGFLPIARMRAGTDPDFAAGCGQFMLVRRDAYLSSGGHQQIRATMHDGLLLPRLLRQHGHRTDLADLTHLASCRMYRSASEVWHGLAKNATEGLAAPGRIVPVTLLLLVGQVLPFVLAAIVASQHRNASFVAISCTAAALLAAYLPRFLGLVRFRQPLKSALLHPLGILLLLVLEWYALARKLSGGSATWKQRSYSSN